MTVFVGFSVELGVSASPVPGPKVSCVALIECRDGAWAGG